MSPFRRHIKQMAFSQKEGSMKYPDIRMGDVEAVWNMLGGEEGVEDLKIGRSSVARRKDHEIGGYVAIPENTNPDLVRKHFQLDVEGGNYTNIPLYGYKRVKLHGWFFCGANVKLTHQKKLFCWHEFSGCWDTVDAIAMLDSIIPCSISEVYSVMNCILEGKIPNIDGHQNIFLVHGVHGILRMLTTVKFSNGWRVFADDVPAEKKCPEGAIQNLRIFAPIR